METKKENDLIEHSYKRINFYVKQIKKAKEQLLHENNPDSIKEINRKIEDYNSQILESRVIIASFNEFNTKDNKFLN